MKRTSKVWRYLVTGFITAAVLATPVNVRMDAGIVHAEAVQWQTLDEKQYSVAPGVLHTSRTLIGNGLRESVHLLEVDPANPYAKVEAVSSHGEVSAAATVSQMLGELEQQGERPVAGTNGDFFSTVGVPSGLMISNGELVSSPSTSKIAMAIMPDHSVKLEENVTMTSKLTKDNGESLTLTMINRTRVATHTNHAFLYNWRFGSSTRTSDGGIEAVIRADDPANKLIPGQPVSGVVESISEASDTPIEPGTFVLSATGSKADWVRQKLAVGTRLRLDISFSKGFGEAEQVISGNSTLGYVLLKNGVVSPTVLDPADANTSDRHPRTMVATKQGKLYLLTVDGRQPGHSDGITMAEGAYYLQSLGMENAINIDGGGSTTYYVRQPGGMHPSLLNRPSDGHDRAVGNAIAIITTAPVGPLNTLVVNPEAPLQVAAGSRVEFEVKGRDAYGNGVPVSREELQWSVQGAVGTVDRNGSFTASLTPGTGHLTVQSGSVMKQINVSVVDALDRLVLEPNPTVIEPGAVAVFQPQAFNTEGQRVWISPERLAWSVEGAIGTVTSDGRLQAVYGTADGKVHASFGQVSAEAVVQVGKLPQLLEPFESTDHMQTKDANAVAGSVTINAVARPNPVRYGTKSLKLTYDFMGKGGTSNAYVNLLDENGEIGREVEGKPYRFGLWVYGDSNRHYLRLGVTDGSGTNRIFDLTEPGALDWTGWKYVTAPVPENTIYPLKVRYIVVSESDPANKNKGAVYLDNLRAEYMDLGEDVTGPVFSDLTPAPGAEVTGLSPSISVKVTDEGSGVDPSSIIAVVDGVSVNATYDPERKRILVLPGSDLSEGDHHIKIEAADKAGTYAIPAAEWSFRVKAPDHLPPVWNGGAVLTVTDVTYHTATIHWNQASDNIGVQGYRIYRNDQPVDTILSDRCQQECSYRMDDLVGYTSYRVEVEAYDAAGNSARSGAVPLLTAKDTLPPGDTVSLQVYGHSHTIQVTFVPPQDKDYAGTRVVISPKGGNDKKERSVELFAPPGVTRVEASSLKHGFYEVLVQALDTSGNLSTGVLKQVKLNEGREQQS
ncbi:phosphodiester glycosidase family protein [Paenibacillus sp. OAS669]|uniref:phosphodiester glycosidase family protein n=1 Tax=Paenibacillus sp. OAS669 TaxID=2663821 RepID=UPI001789F7E1|nr:phosphodiester glycosidase family protein [Paenibacillus sp. OAS669]MBE1442060.1 exopolysaccharide biosynthesis protein [Paenibacillus sp. OAS669]